MSGFEPISALSNLATSVIDKIFPDKTEAAKAKLRYFELQQEGVFKEQELKVQLATLGANNVKAEIQGESAAQRNWRPHFMYVMMANICVITIYNYLIYPFVHIWVPTFPILTAPPQLWSVIELGMTGYVVSRGGEKIATTVMDKWPKK